MADITIVANKSSLPVTEAYDYTYHVRIEPAVAWIAFDSGNVVVLASAPVGDHTLILVNENAGVITYDYLFVTVNNSYSSTTESDVLLASAPQNYGFDKQAIKLKLNSNGGQYTTRGVKARRVIVADSIPTAASTITFTRDGETIEFTFVNDATTTTTPRQIKRNNGTGLSLQNWLKMVVVPKLKQFKFFSDYYDITVGGNAIIFIAKTYGDNMNLTPGFNTAFSYIGSLSNTNPVLKPNYKLYVRIAMCKESNSIDFNDIVEFEGVPDENNECEFFLNRALDFRSELNYPDNGGVIGATPNMQAMRPYLYMYGSKYGEPIVYYPSAISNTTNPPYVLDGGINHFDETPALITAHNINGKTAFLTNMPEHVVVHPKMPFVLSWIVSGTPIWIRQADLDENGNVGAESTYIADVRTPYLHNFIRSTDTFIASAYDAETLTEGMARKFWINASSEENPLTSDEPRKPITAHVAEFWAYDDNRFFWFKNSFGVYELMWVHGLAKQSIETTKESIEKYYPGGALPYAERRVLEDRENWYKEEVDLSTGVIDTNEQTDFNAYKKWLTEFFNSEDVYEIIDGKFYPIVFTSKSYNFGSIWDNVLNVPFKYRYAFDNGGVLNQYVPPVYAPVELPGGETPGGGDPGGEGGVVNVKRADGTLISAVTAPADFTVNNTAVTLRDSAGNLLSTTSVKPAFTDTNITAPDGEAQLVNTVAAPIGDVAIKAGETKEIVVPDTEITVKNSLGFSVENVEVPSCQPNDIVVDDATVVVKNTIDEVIDTVGVPAASSGAVVVGNSTVNVRDTADNILSSESVPAENVANIIVENTQISLNSDPWLDELASSTSNIDLVDQDNTPITPILANSTTLKVQVFESDSYIVRRAARIANLVITGNSNSILR